MRILAISTSTRRGSVAVADETGALLGASSYDGAKGHAEQVLAAVDLALRGAAVSRSELTGLACDIGPGSFTGVRVGLATSKGIALALGLPLAKAGSLEAMALAGRALGTSAELVAPVIDAKKGEVFLMALDASGAEVLAPRHVPRDEAAALLEAAAAGRSLAVVGEAAAELSGLAAVLLRGASADLPDAAFVARLGIERLSFGPGDDLATLEPRYVRAPDARPSALGPAAPPG